MYWSYHSSYYFPLFLSFISFFLLNHFLQCYVYCYKQLNSYFVAEGGILAPVHKQRASSVNQTSPPRRDLSFIENSAEKLLVFTLLRHGNDTQLLKVRTTSFVVGDSGLSWT